MNILNDIRTYLVVTAAIVAAFIGAWLQGKKSGKQQAEAKRNEEILETQKRIHEAGHLSNDDIAERLRHGEF
jgi:phage-related minor tail protein